MEKLIIKQYNKKIRQKKLPYFFMWKFSIRDILNNKIVMKKSFVSLIMATYKCNKSRLLHAKDAAIFITKARVNL